MLLQGRAFKGLGPKLCGLALLKASLAHSSWPWEQALWLGWGPSVKPVCAQNCCVSSRYIQEEPGPLEHNQQNFRNLGEEKAVSGYLGFGSRPASPPASRLCPPKRLCGHTFHRSDGSAAIFKPLPVSSLLSEERLLRGSQNTCAKNGHSPNRKFFMAAGFPTQRSVFCPSSPSSLV